MLFKYIVYVWLIKFLFLNYIYLMEVESGDEKVEMIIWLENFFLKKKEFWLNNWKE